MGQNYYFQSSMNCNCNNDILFKCSAPKTWRRPDGKAIEMDTQFTIRARELQSIYKCIILKDLSQDERLDILLTLKHTVKVCPLSHGEGVSTVTWRRCVHCHMAKVYTLPLGLQAKVIVNKKISRVLESISSFPLCKYKVVNKCFHT